MLVYTSITKSYLPKARVLASSLKVSHPDWYFVVVFSDSLPAGFDVKNEPFDEVVLITDLGIGNFDSWVFKHNIVELCTAVKGVAGVLLSQRDGVNKIMYLDPDIRVFGSLSDLDVLLDEHDILLTPHLLHPEIDDLAIQDNEMSALKHGVYNLGFFAAKSTGQGLDFLNWWASRLNSFCYDDIPSGLFTDQRWCDLAPAFFSKLHIVRDEGYNVATWNIAHRKLSLVDDIFYVNDKPLKFYHFTGYDSGAGFSMLAKYASGEDVANLLWNSYANDLELYGQNYDLDKSWHYGVLDNGEVISQNSRVMYRLDPNLMASYTNPFKTGIGSYNDFYKKNLGRASVLDCKLIVREQFWKLFLSPRCMWKLGNKFFDVMRTIGFKEALLKVVRMRGLN